MNKILLIILGLIVLGFIIYSAVTAPSEQVVTLTWTATGDDMNSGTADKYELRYSDFPITEMNWTTCTKIMKADSLEPSVAGTQEFLTVSLPLESETNYYFALKVYDEAGNVSALSNVYLYKSKDIVSPAPVTDLRSQ